MTHLYYESYHYEARSKDCVPMTVLFLAHLDFEGCPLAQMEGGVLRILSMVI
jgi:hypothetical protein